MMRAEVKPLTQPFAASPFRVGEWVGSYYVEQPSGVTHAKCIGTVRTLCGLSAESWFKFMDQPFEGVQSDRCPKCVELLQNDRRSSAGLCGRDSASRRLAKETS